MIETAILPSKGGVPVIDIQHVTKRYGALYALRDVSLHVEKGSVLGLLGQNGAGKTTLINILTGYLAPTEGRALLAGHDALPEVPPLYDEMTVREYLRFAAQLKGVESRAVPAHVDEIMELCGLTQMQRRLLSHLSKGYRQRAGLAQALCGDPEILVLDEPLSGVDIDGEKQLLDMLDEIRTRYDLSILLSTHDFATLNQFADKVILLNKRILKVGPPDEVTASPEFYETFHLRMGKGGM